jgi:hypothetical protein
MFMKMHVAIHRFLSVALLATFVGSAFAQDETVSSSKKTNITIQSDNGTYRWKTSTGMTDFNIEVRGKIDVTDDDKDIKSISDGGYLEITKTVFGSKRAIVIESLGGGKIKKEYYEGRSKMEWEPNGREWLGEILPDIVRSTTLAAESRVTRYFKQGGTNAVLAEIDRLKSDHTRAHYAGLLMKLSVQPKDYASIINKVSTSIDSDHYRAEFLRNHVSKFLQNKEATHAVFVATSKIDSDHYKTEVIKEALKGQIASIENVKVILQAAGQMESDHYITEVLTSLLRQDNLSDAVISEIISEITASLRLSYFIAETR